MPPFKTILWFFVLIVLSSCQNENVDPWVHFASFDTDYDTYSLSHDTSYQPMGVKAGAVNGITEASGLAPSHVNPGMIWTHNDSGHGNIIYLLNTSSGEIVASYEIPEIENIDWEDIETGPGPMKGVSYLYIGDIGDNKKVYINRKIYRIPEPYFIDAHRGKTNLLSLPVEIITYVYPDGPQNAETLLLDPWNLDLYVVTKYGAQSMLYVAKYPQRLDTTFTLSKVGDFPFREAVAGSISKNGLDISIKTYDQIFYWKRNKGEALWKTLSNAPSLLPYNPVEPKGEAFCWVENGYVTLSERSNDIMPVLYKYDKK
jgi:hypothetical protein